MAAVRRRRQSGRLQRCGVAILPGGLALLSACHHRTTPLELGRLLSQPERRHTYAEPPTPDEAISWRPLTDEPEDLLPPKVLTLADARGIAVRGNPDIHAAMARLQTAAARVDEAGARYLPTIGFSHTSARTFHTPASRNRLSTLLQPLPAFPADIDSTQSIAVSTLLNALRRPLFGLGGLRGNSSSFSEHSTSFTIAYTIFDGFIREAQLLAALLVKNAAAYSLDDARRLIIRAVDTAYYQVQLAEEQVRIARADEAFSREQFEETQKLRAAGRATQADVDNFRVRMLAAQANLTAAIGLRETGRVALAELMGLPEAALPDAIELSPLEVESEREMTVPEVEPWLGKALANRPDIRQLSALRESEAENIRAAEGLFYPTVNISGSWGFDRGSSIRYNVDDQSSAGAIELRWDLYTGGARRARLRAARSALDEAAAELRRRRLAVQGEVRNAVIDLADAQEQIRLQQESLDVARENRRIIQAAYLAGKETLTRLNEAQRDFIEADVNLARARIRLRQAWSDLYAAAAAYDVEASGQDGDGS